MVLDPQTCYRALLAHDARFDGTFFVGVSSTGIYCRPVCRVKTPKPENCTFFETAALAEAAGYRPCLRCRPELAPGNATIDAGQRIAQRAATLIENGLGVSEVAERTGVSTRHLRRVFRIELGVTPIAFAQTQRLLLAKRLLTDTALPVTTIAFTAGFGSLSRFDAVFRERYHFSPAKLRGRSTLVANPDVLRLDLSYRPPYDWKTLVAFLAARAIGGVELVDASTYRRTVQINNQTGWIEIRPDELRPLMRVTASMSLARVVPAVLARVRHLLDLSCSPTSVTEALGPLAAERPGLRVPGAFDGFEIAVRAILGQQVSVAAARTLACRLAHAFGNPIDTPHGGLCRAFPMAAHIARLKVEDLTDHGVLASRARTILALAREVAAGSLHLEPGANVAETLVQLRSILGIGEWTAQYIAMRALAWPDAFPHTDLGLMRALNEKNPRRILDAGEAWRPWRAYAVMHLWAAGSSNGSVR